MDFYSMQSGRKPKIAGKAAAAKPPSGSSKQFWLIAAVAFLAACAPMAQGQANVHGTWRTLPTLMPINPVHTALLPNGKIILPRPPSW
jgi:hypothetical protein